MFPSDLFPSAKQFLRNGFNFRKKKMLLLQQMLIFIFSILIKTPKTESLLGCFHTWINWKCSETFPIGPDHLDICEDNNRTVDSWQSTVFVAPFFHSFAQDFMNITVLVFGVLHLGNVLIFAATSLTFTLLLLLSLPWYCPTMQSVTATHEAVT